MLRFSFIFCALFSLSSLASVDILSASFDGTSNNITMEVVYGGGCMEHSFELEFSPICLQSMPLQCSAQLKHTQGEKDPCKARIFKSLTFSAAKFTSRPAYLDLSADFSKKRIFVANNDESQNVPSL